MFEIKNASDLSNASNLSCLLLEAGLNGDRQRLQLLAVTAIRSIRKSCPEFAAQLGAILAASEGGDASSLAMRRSPEQAEYDFLASEIAELESLLAAIPIEHAINRCGLESRFREVKAAIARIAPRVNGSPHLTRHVVHGHETTPSNHCNLGTAVAHRSPNCGALETVGDSGRASYKTTD